VATSRDSPILLLSLQNDLLEFGKMHKSYCSISKELKVYDFKLIHNSN